MSYNINSQHLTELFTRTKRAKNQGNKDYQMDAKCNKITYGDIEIERKVQGTHTEFFFYLHNQNEKVQIAKVSTSQERSTSISDIAYAQKLFKLLRKVKADNNQLLGQLDLFN